MDQLTVPLICVGILLIASQVNSQSLQYTESVVLDIRERPGTFMAKAVKAQTRNSNLFKVQLWEKGEDAGHYKLTWQFTIRPLLNELAEEVYELPEELNINPNKFIGIINQVSETSPGPIHASHDLEGQVILSHNDSTRLLWDELNVGEITTFDNLGLPYQIPVSLCQTFDCADNDDEFLDDGKGINGPGNSTLPPPTKTTSSQSTEAGMTNAPPTPNPQAVVQGDDDDDDFWQSKEFSIAILVWNIVLTVLLIIVICVVMYICTDMEKQKKEHNRAKHKYPDDPIPYATTSTGTSAVEEGRAVGGSETWRSSTVSYETTGSTEQLTP